MMLILYFMLKIDKNAQYTWKLKTAAISKLQKKTVDWWLPSPLGGDGKWLWDFF